jgi:hypothetical protein
MGSTVSRGVTEVVREAVRLLSRMATGRRSFSSQRSGVVFMSHSGGAIVDKFRP